jgi:hypothetical protein
VQNFFSQYDHDMSSLVDSLEQTHLQLAHKQLELAENFAKLIDELIVTEKHGDADPTASHGNVGKQDAGSGGVAEEQQKHTHNSYDSDCTFELLFLALARTLVLNCFI